MSVRRRLLRDAFLVLAVYLAIRAVLMCRWYGIGWDAHAYYVAWSGGLYEALPTSVDAYNYSPLFAQVIWPLTFLPWGVFCAVCVVAAATGIAWPPPSPGAGGRGVARLPARDPVRQRVLAAGRDGCRRVLPPERVVRGRIHQVLPCVGPVWFLARGEWRRLATPSS